MPTSMMRVSNNSEEHNAVLLMSSMVKTVDRFIFGSKDTGLDLFFIGIGDQVPTSAKPHGLQHFICTSECTALKQRSLENVPKRPRPV